MSFAQYGDYGQTGTHLVLPVKTGDTVKYTGFGTLALAWFAPCT